MESNMWEKWHWAGKVEGLASWPGRLDVRQFQALLSSLWWIDGPRSIADELPAESLTFPPCAAYRRIAEWMRAKTILLAMAAFGIADPPTNGLPRSGDGNFEFRSIFASP
ncbi:hypothetical protein KM043_000499 [Ampulex compressa]|nr:hypothetical protein KM043_000499 [Ampulex compressa]